MFRLSASPTPRAVGAARNGMARSPQALDARPPLRRLRANVPEAILESTEVERIQPIKAKRQYVNWRLRGSSPGAQRQGAMVALAGIALLDTVFAPPPLQWISWVAGVLVAAAAALLAARVAGQPGAHSRRWQAQALACTALMLTLFSRGGHGPADDPLGWLVHLALAALLAAAAALGQDRPRGRAWAMLLLLDAGTVAVATGLFLLVLLPAAATSTPMQAAFPACFAASGYATLVATRGRVRKDPSGPDALLLGGVAALGVYIWGDAARVVGWGPLSAPAAPAVALVGAAALAGSAWQGTRGNGSAAEPEPREDARVRLAPVAAAGLAILLLSGLEMAGGGTRIGFLGVLVLFGLIVARLVSTLLENRQLLRRVERAGVFEEKLRDLGAALVAALDRKEAPELACRTAQVAIGADTVLLWAVDHTARQLEAIEVLGPKRGSLIGRRISLDDSSWLAARVARSGESEIVPHATSSKLSNPFLNVLLRAQALLAVPVIRDRTVLAVLVCVNARSPNAYGPQELAKAELLASQVAVALDNAHQHEQQRRRLEEVTALYQFAQSAHTSLSSTDLAAELLRILRERLRFTHAAVWLRDPTAGTLHLAASDSPARAPLLGARPSELAMQAFKTREPVHAGLEWAEPGADYAPERSGIRSQLAVPMVLKRRVIGVVDLESKHPHAYTMNDERLLVSLGNHAALAIENLHLLEEARTVEALKELDRMKSELLSTVSHELRTPLGCIKGYATTLLAHESKLRRDERREFLAIIDSEADRLTELIENLLDLSRLEAGVLRINPAPALLGTVAQEVTRKVQLSAPRHQLELDWADDREVRADARRIYQVLQNLLTNAVKYSPDGGRIVVSGAFTPRELVVSVSDEGLGLPARELDRIFDRFHRVGGEVSRRIGGTGLGLAICKAFVEAHHGRIWVESDGEGKGSTFRFALPLAPLGEITSRLPKDGHDYQEANRSRS
jgi:signal transduction histidine kinase